MMVEWTHLTERIRHLPAHLKIPRCLAALALAVGCVHRNPPTAIVYSVTGDEPAQLRAAYFENGDFIYTRDYTHYEHVFLRGESKENVEAAIKALDGLPKRIGVTAGEGTALVFLSDKTPPLAITVLGGEDDLPGEGPLRLLMDATNRDWKGSSVWAPTEYVLYLTGSGRALNGAKVCNWPVPLPAANSACIVVDHVTQPTWQLLVDLRDKGCTEFKGPSGLFYVWTQQPVVGTGRLSLPTRNCLNITIGSPR